MVNIEKQIRVSLEDAETLITEMFEKNHVYLMRQKLFQKDCVYQI